VMAELELADVVFEEGAVEEEGPSIYSKYASNRPNKQNKDNQQTDDNQWTVGQILQWIESDTVIALAIGSFFIIPLGYIVFEGVKCEKNPFKCWWDFFWGGLREVFCAVAGLLHIPVPGICIVPFSD